MTKIQEVEKRVENIEEKLPKEKELTKGDLFGLTFVVFAVIFVVSGLSQLCIEGLRIWLAK